MCKIGKNIIAIPSKDSTIVLFDTKNYMVLKTFPAAFNIKIIQWLTPSSIFIGTENGKLVIVNFLSGNVLKEVDS